MSTNSVYIRKNIFANIKTQNVHYCSYLELNGVGGERKEKYVLCIEWWYLPLSDFCSSLKNDCVQLAFEI